MDKLTIDYLNRYNAYLSKLIDEDYLGNANNTLTEEIEHNNRLIKLLRDE